MIKATAISLAILVWATRSGLTGEPSRDSTAAQPVPARAVAAECRTAVDRLDDFASDPAAAAYLTSAAASGLAKGLALCRTGRTDDGALLLRKAFASIRIAD